MMGFGKRKATVGQSAKTSIRKRPLLLRALCFSVRYWYLVRPDQRFLLVAASRRKTRTLPLVQLFLEKSELSQ